MRAGLYTTVAILFTGSAGFILQPAAEDVPVGEAAEPVILGPAPSGVGPEPLVDITPELSPIPLALALAPAPEPPATRRALRIALQAGHWRNSEVPDELDGLRDNGGTRGGGRDE